MSLLPQFGFLELLLVAALALVVVGPRDLPKLMRSAGRAMGQMRRMATEFSSAFEQMAREADLEDMRKEIEELKKQNPVNEVKRAVDDVVAPVKSVVNAEKDALRKAGENVAKPAEADTLGDDAPADTAPDPQADNAGSDGSGEAATADPRQETA